VLFDPKTFSDTTTYEDPRRFPEGLSFVMINGETVIDELRHTAGAPSGMFIRNHRSSPTGCDQRY
jgi:N-acyl-D-amino-acid deacylase